MSGSPQAVLPQIDTVAAVLAEHVRERPGAPALVCGDASYTYAELAEQVRAAACGLSRLGVRQGTTVGLLCTNRVEWVVTALATISLGGQVAAFTTWSKRWDLEHLLRASRCEVLVAVSQFGGTSLEPLLRELLPEAWTSAQPGWTSPDYPSLRELVLIDCAAVPSGARAFAQLVADGQTGSSAEDGAVSTRDDVALVLYTSGSTARPKAVVLQQGHALEHGYDVGLRMGAGAHDRIWLAVPLFWSYGGANALMVSLTHGCCLVLQEFFEAGEALDLIARERCTLGYLLPNITAALLAHPSFSRNRVESLTRGMTIGARGDVLAAATDLGVADVCNAYGSTEIYGCCSATPHDWPLERRLGCQGPPLPRITVSIRDAFGEAVPVGDVGEITVSGQVTTGYLDQPAETANALSESGELRTGDLGFLDEEGVLHYVARATDMIKSAGINIAPAEVEDFLRTHPEVLEAAVVGVEDPAKGQVAVAYVTVAPGASADEQVLTAFCREHIASFKVPTRIVVGTQALPTTETGKLARKVVKERASQVWTNGPA